MDHNLRPAWAAFPGSHMRHKVFVPESIKEPKEIILQAADTLFQRFVLSEGMFPLRIEIFDVAAGGEPLGEILVGLEFKDDGEDITAVFREIKDTKKP